VVGTYTDTFSFSYGYATAANSPIGSLYGSNGVVGPNSSALAINANGISVGAATASSSGNSVPVSTTNGGASFHTLGTNTGTISQAAAINSSGKVAGYFTTSGGDTHAFTAGYLGIPFTDLGGTTSQANGINNSGQVVGVTSSGGVPTAYRTSPDGTIGSATLLAPLANPPSSGRAPAMPTRSTPPGKRWACLRASASVAVFRRLASLTRPSGIRMVRSAIWVC
jgi:probable HAF family extracellular repeat protein